ncbi:MAG: large conductance mechanosensitive channel protein MscL [Tenericutes bacterium]|nr:large conductance mechanosensitive channel protein MscL [Mycoplasmatota bacterium]
MKKHLKNFINEFKKFMDRGNVVDLSVAVVMGASFGKITTSFVNDIIMTIIGVIIGGINFTNLTISIGAATINYGIFIQNIIDFIIIGIFIFFFVRTINRFKEDVKDKFSNEENQKEIKVPTKSQDVLLLEEIRDLLKENKKAK